MKKYIYISIILILISLKSFSHEDTSTYDFGYIGFGIEFGPCTGIFLLDGEPDKKLNNMWCYANVGLAFSYRRFHYLFRLGGISTTIKENLEFGEKWEKHNDFGSLNFHLAWGYQIVNTRNINIIPFASGGISRFSTNKEDSDDYTRTNYKASVALSIAFDYKINLKVKEKNKYPGSDYTINYINFRFMPGVYPNYFSNLDLNGNLYFLSFSIGTHIIYPRLKSY